MWKKRRRREFDICRDLKFHDRCKDFDHHDDHHDHHDDHWDGDDDCFHGRRRSRRCPKFIPIVRVTVDCTPVTVQSGCPVQTVLIPGHCVTSRPCW